MTDAESDPVIENEVTPLDDAVVRNTAAAVKASARRAHRTEVWLVVVAAVLMVAVAGFTGWNTYRLREVNRDMAGLVRILEANQEAQQAYNEAHAESAGANFTALLANIRCFTGFFVSFNQAVAAGAPPPDKAVLDGCFQPSPPPPAPAPLPSEKRDGR